MDIKLSGKQGDNKLIDNDKKKLFNNSAREKEAKNDSTYFD